MSLHTIKLLVKREFKRNFRNISFIISLLLPILIIFLNYEVYKGDEILRQHAFSILFNVNVLSISVIVYSVAVISDREYKTDRALNYAGIRFFEIILSKNILTISIIIVNQLFLCTLYKMSIKSTILFAVISCLIGLVIQILVTVICYMSPNHGFTSNLNAVIFIILLMAPELTGLSSLLKYIAMITPSYHSKLLVDYFMLLHSDINVYITVSVIFAWAVLPILYATKKRLFELKAG